MCPYLTTWDLLPSHTGAASIPPTEMGPGNVYLVGTGPGDPTLLTIRAVQLMQSADVILYDRLVSDDILRLVSPSALMVYVGKHSGLHTRTQEEIHRLLLAFSQSGATVLRLKGGDPYVYGRGGEEVQYLKSRGIKVHCIPGITAAAGICAELGIPMTHRGVATSARFLTGHSREGGEDSLDCQVTSAGSDAKHTTLIVYMGLATLPQLQRQLAESGVDPWTPAVAVERGTTVHQRVVFSPLDQLPLRVSDAGLQSPTLIIIGEVVALAPGWEEWQEQGRPLEWKEDKKEVKGFESTGSEEIIAISRSLDGLKR
jgi:uroporphyrin-III C-methyltransferase